MQDLIVGIGLVLVVEGLIWALFPHIALSVLESAKETPEPTLRFLGVLSVSAGVVVVWFIRG